MLQPFLGLLVEVFIISVHDELRLFCYTIREKESCPNAVRVHSFFPYLIVKTLVSRHMERASEIRSQTQYEALLTSARSLEMGLQGEPVPFDQIAPDRIVELRQSDFDRGTVRVRTSNVLLRLVEDVNFHPNPDHDFLPTEDQAEIYPKPPYQLGFFAAITIEAERVILDLNGHRIQQSVEHALQQRFFACIELGYQPFVGGQGPATFDAMTGCRDVVIRNGVLGRSSHHGIHSPGGATNVLVEDVMISEFEVAGAHLNGAENTQIRRVHIGPCRQTVPVISTYSQARFIRRHLDMILARDPSVGLAFASGSLSGSKIRNDLEEELNRTFQEVSQGKKVTSTVFGNDANGLSDCNVYGLVMNAKGVAIGGLSMDFACEPSMGNTRNSLVDVVVHGVDSKVREVVGVNNPGTECCKRYGGGGLYCTGPAGDVFPIDEISDEEGRYRGTVLSNAQLLVAQSATTDEERGTAGIHEVILNWALSGEPLNLEEPFYRVYGGDSMAHTQGNIGFFIQNAKKLDIVRGCISKVMQRAPGATFEGPPETNPSTEITH